MEVTLEETIALFNKYKYAIRMGANNLSKWWGIDKALINEARKCIHSSRRANNETPKILIFDIETAPMVAYVWKRWKENISLEQTISESFMLCWSAKWLYSDEVMGDILTPEEVKKQNDYRVVKSLYDLINQCDILVAYNGNNFDIPYMNSRFFVYDLVLPKPYKSVDPYITAKKVFRFSSNKMDNIATQLGLHNKISTDFNLWKGCMEGNEFSLKAMLTYNKQDVRVLEEIYDRMLPWLIDHPNVTNYNLDSNGRCIKCNSELVKPLNRYYIMPSGRRYALYRCTDCGTVFRARLSKDKKGTAIFSNIKN